MPRLPAYCVHKARNLAYMTLGGREVYLGRAHSPESHAKYRETVSALLAGLSHAEAVRPTRKPVPLSVAELGERWYHAMLDKFGPTHQKSYEALHAARELSKAHATARVAEFGPKPFKAIRDRLVAEGRSRQFINRRMNSIRRCFRWGVAEELVPGDRIQALAAVDGLRHGAAPETPPRRAADPDAVQVVLHHLEATGSHGAAAMLRFLWATGCRPGEACRARWPEFTLGAEMPHYRPATHKTAHHGIERLIPLNADALAAIGGSRQLGDGFVFLNTNGEPFTPNALLLAVRRAIAATGCADWSPYGLRHLACTEALAATGSEAAAAALLGHTARSTIVQRYTRDRFALSYTAAKSIERKVAS